MHRHYRHFTFTQRCQIMFMSRSGKSISQIAGELGWHKSTIPRKLRQNRFYLLDYWDENAQIRADRPRCAASRRYRLKNERIQSCARKKLEANWSRELVSGRIDSDLAGCCISLRPSTSNSNPG